MKSIIRLASVLLVAVVCVGCRTISQFPNADLNQFEVRARHAIANMPVRAWQTDPLPHDHPWYAPMREQNLRIAKAPANFSLYFPEAEGRRIIYFNFQDPTGLYPERYVEFDISTGELINCNMPTYGGTIGAKFVTDGIPLPENKEIAEP